MDKPCRPVVEDLLAAQRAVVEVSGHVRPVEAHRAGPDELDLTLTPVRGDVSGRRLAGPP
jgi:hypothetical protein